MNLHQSFVWFTLCLLFSLNNAQETKPNILIVIADDMGWNDVSFHGSNQIPTPNIDSMAYNGIVLNRFYTQHICTPSRAALLTGKYPIRTGMQGFPIRSGENRSLPIEVPTMPQLLKKLGYDTYLIGKWHLGHSYKNSTPTYKGFDYHYGPWNGYLGFFDHTTPSYGMDGLDFHENLTPVWSDTKKYITDLYTSKTKQIINKHKNSKTSNPFFLILSHAAPHAGLNGALEIKNITEVNEKFPHIKDENRRLYAELVTTVDESLGEIFKTLAKNKILNETIVIFLSDNGAQSVGIHQNFGSNWPLRGVKFTLFEGGVRGTSVIFNPLQEIKGINNDLLHLVDLFPTLCEAAGGDCKSLDVDGLNFWGRLQEEVNYEKNERNLFRNDLLINIDEVANLSAIIGEGGRYKLVEGTYNKSQHDDYYGETGRGEENPLYDYNLILNSEVNKALTTINRNLKSKEVIENTREILNLEKCSRRIIETTCMEGCLFDLHEDPCESKNLADDLPEVVKNLKKRLNELRSEMMVQTNMGVDLMSNPKFCNGSWFTWLDGCEGLSSSSATPNGKSVKIFTYFVVTLIFTSVLYSYIV